jgi:hypothetical protein
MEIDDIASELYGLAPQDFTAVRNARAKEAKESGDRELAEAVQALRKPTVGAWLLNQLVRRRRGEVEQSFELGARLRAAQGTLGAAELRALGEQRRRLTSAMAQQAAGMGREAGRTVSAQVVADVEETLRSAMVDPDAGAALASGLLVETFSSTGLGPVDLSRVVALGATAPGRPASLLPEGTSGGAAASARDEHAVAAARRAVEEAEAALGVAGAEAEEARRLAGEARRRREDLRSELEGVRRRLGELELSLTAATDAEDSAARTHISAVRGERSAVEAAERARRRLDRLLDGDVAG